MCLGWKPESICCFPSESQLQVPRSRQKDLPRFNGSLIRVTPRILPNIDVHSEAIFRLLTGMAVALMTNRLLDSVICSSSRWMTDVITPTQSQNRGGEATRPLKPTKRCTFSATVTNELVARFPTELFADSCLREHAVSSGHLFLLPKWIFSYP